MSEIILVPVLMKISLSGSPCTAQQRQTPATLCVLASPFFFPYHYYLIIIRVCPSVKFSLGTETSDGCNVTSLLGIIER